MPAQLAVRICERSKRQGRFCGSICCQPLPISSQRQCRWRMLADPISWVPVAAKLIVMAATIRDQLRPRGHQVRGAALRRHVYVRRSASHSHSSEFDRMGHPPGRRTRRQRERTGMNFSRQPCNRQSYQRLSSPDRGSGPCGPPAVLPNHNSTQPARRVAASPHIETQQAVTLISIKKPFVVSGYETSDSANSVEFFIITGVSVCVQPARAEEL
jgi:hypothetical protein